MTAEKAVRAATKGPANVGPAGGALPPTGTRAGALESVEGAANTSRNASTPSAPDPKTTAHSGMGHLARAGPAMHSAAPEETSFGSAGGLGGAWTAERACASGTLSGSVRGATEIASAFGEAAFVADSLGGPADCELSASA
jgi:hypothetical protein